MATKKQIIFPIAVLIIGIGLAVGFSTMKKPPEEKPEQDNRPLVSAQTVHLGAINLDVQSYGIVKAKDHTMLVAQVSGQVISVLDKFVQGGFVNKGDILARIDPNDYEAAMIEAQASLAQASSNLEVERAQAHVAQAEWDRIKDDSNQVIPSQLYLRKPQLAEKLARFRAAQAAEKRAKRNLERTYIKAPYDAIITAREISLGSVVTPGSQLGALSATEVAEIRLPVADNELQYLTNGGIGATVTIDAKVAGQPATWQAKIVRSEGVIDQKSRMSYLVAQIETPYESEQALRFGSYINATIAGRKIDNAVAVPHHLVKGGKIAVLNDDLTLSFKTLDIVREHNGLVITASGLSEGEQLITSALEYPNEGMQVKLNNNSKPANATQLALKEE